MAAPRTAGKLGRQPNQGKPRIRLTAAHVPPAYSPPPSLDRYSAVLAASWGMDGNGPDPSNPPNVPDGAGDCTLADADHTVKSDQVAAGNPEVRSTATEVLTAYAAVTGYDPSQTQPDGSNPTDNGAEMQGVRAYWQKTGIRLGGTVHKILLFAELDVHNDNLLRWALDQFGAISIGVSFPVSAMDQFNAGQPWDVVSNDGGIDGGHAVAVVGYDGTYWYVVTWGQIQKVTPAWWRAYVEEAWTALTQDFVNAHTGLDPLAGTLYDLGQQFAAVTGKPNPVPPPIPSPTPAPTPAPVPPAPTPTPAPDAADIALVATLGPWSREHHIGRNEVAAKAFHAWMVAKGLV